MTMKFRGTAVAAEFVPDGDPHRDDQDDPPRPAGVYLTVRLDDQQARVGAGTVTVEYDSIKKD